MLSAKLIYRRVPDLKVLVKREVHKSYYDLLGLTPKASQVDIKHAYYKKSMLYHPDKGEGDPERFREITTAYEVLGNLKLRKMYDRGMLPISGGLPKVSPADVEEDKAPPPPYAAGQGQANQHFYKTNTDFPDLEEDLRKKRMNFTGKTKEYDFDAWTQAHYSESFSKQETSKRYRREREKEQEVDAQLKKADLIFTTFFFSIVAYIVFHLQRSKNQDYGRPWRPK